MPNEPLPSDPSDDSVEAAESKARLAEERLESAMEGYRALRNQTVDLRSQLKEAQAEAERATEKVTEKLRKQFERERQRERELFYRKYLEVLDNFDRAFDTSEARAASPSLMEGFIMVRNQLLAIIRERGLERVRTLGLPYDPATSEAVQLEEVSDSVRDGVVIREVVRGYQFEGHLMRAAQVVVGRYSGTANEDAPEPGDDATNPARDAPEIANDDAANESQESRASDESGEIVPIPAEDLPPPPSPDGGRSGA